MTTSSHKVTIDASSPRFSCFIHRNRHYHSIHAWWLGSVCRRVSGDDG